jgi:hypothetical protein
MEVSPIYSVIRRRRRGIHAITPRQSITDNPAHIAEGAAMLSTLGMT